jgi:antitoxin (DNA-binding transcriptional repressor) of toxin-antitoxin stability system
MGQVHHIRQADLGRAARRVLDAVRRGETAVIDDHGEPEAAIMDIIDYRILRAAVRYCTQRPEIVLDENGPSDEAVTAIADPQERYDLVWAHYLAEAMSLSRVGHLLGLAWIDLRERCNRLGLPLRTGPATAEELRQEVEAMERRMATSRE